MHFSLDHRTATLSVGEFADFSIGPREGGAGPAGLWRAQLGQHWHNELRARAEQEAAAAGAPPADLQFEVPIEGVLVHRGWTVTLAGRIDQCVAGTLREIKSVTDALPADEAALRAAYPAYFIQLATYLVLRRSLGLPPARAELVFVEAGSGLLQAIALTPFDEALVHHQLDALAGFLDLRLQAANRRRALRFTRPFAELRAGQENVQADLAAALARPGSVVFFEAPTGFGKTGCALEFALGQLKAGRFHRLVWLTGKATGQLHVMATLATMTAPRDDSAAGTPVAAWQVRPKSEHCVNHVYHCLRDACTYLDGGAERWPGSGLARFHLDERAPRDLESLRAAGRDARVCPYEITRTALAFQDAWVGDYNYVFAPDNRGIFLDQPGYDPAETLLVLDEAHNLPARVADAHSHAVAGGDLAATYHALRDIRAPAPLLLAWEAWTRTVSRLPAADELDPIAEADVRDALDRLAPLVGTTALDHAALGPEHSAAVWEALTLAEWLDDESLTRLLWSPRAGELSFTCLDAAPVIGGILRGFGAALLMSATLNPAEHLAAACGLDRAPVTPAARATPPPADKLGSLTKRRTRQLYRQLTSGAELLRVEEDAASAQPGWLRAHAPWREGAYDVAIDLRVSTTLRERERHHGVTADTIAAARAASSGPVAVFFPSYAYADAVQRALEGLHPGVRVALQPRGTDLAAQGAWVEESLLLADALFLVLGSGFAEGIDLLGGRLSHALVVGPALPEVNAVQRARLAALERGGQTRDAAFRRIYQVPGLQKVNQALGRLVRAPGHRAKVLLHCRRFADPSYASLLAPEYQLGREIALNADLAEWLGA